MAISSNTIDGTVNHSQNQLPVLIDRSSLLEQIRPFYADGLIKILKGLPRTGKSSLLRLIAADLAQRFSRPASAFLFLDFAEGTDSPDYLALHELITKAAKDTPCRLTVLINEVEKVAGWELCLNSLRADNVCDLYVASSDPGLLAGENATHLAGRTIAFRVFPLSFAEYCSQRRETENPDTLTDAALFAEYAARGGMPGLSHYPPGQEGNDRAARGYLRDTFDAITLRDIAGRCGFRNTRALTAVFQTLLQCTGRRISAGDIAEELKRRNQTAARDTLLAFLKAGTEGFLFHRLDLRDSEGRRIGKSESRFYPADHGFREAFFPGAYRRDTKTVLENIVCVELLRRGARVCCGRDIDFIAEYNGKKCFIQVTPFLDTEDTLKRTFAPLAALRNNDTKLVLSLDSLSRSCDGISHCNIIDFLLDRQAA